YGQRDPLVEYKREAHDMFAELTATVRREVAHGVYRAQLVRTEAPRRREMHTNAPSEAPSPRRTAAKAGRNDPCPCGSGRKYKNCCLRKEGGGGQAEAPAGAGQAPRKAQGGPQHKRRHR
ncbi:MAG: SEC-C metal-binding domain-containing protein, partial [Anaerolineae bacterium]|nr:SEC-C metal-binding domain-containing protein [Anaerolineae bacterium]